MVPANIAYTITQDPNIAGSIPIARSANDRSGIEFTWSVWVWIDGSPGTGYNTIFYKGDDHSVKPGTTPTAAPHSNGPGLYLTSPNTLQIYMDTFDNVPGEQLQTIKDMPLYKWVNIIVRCQGNIIDTYINGTITTSSTLIGVPRQNYGDIFVAGLNPDTSSNKTGFAGYISNLWYYDYALGITDILGIVKKGPNTKLVSTSSGTFSNKISNYLSLNWYMGGYN